ncbi:Nif11-like leader peptide family natural product precursor [Fortiea sp. LEGE XX443]|uniref:Nif11-like leader peptide family natural product precursor n=1 Tax=Fortiea sp. LEGE XX443 TaxID=1828611 RepID=UPI00187EA5FD|nr:Nif11-like leader peptide family natural product precursor [Fortiea sp. LEGE XX443]MBE9008253.1 Nif11-like leader peptide family natural product precursor [Fortiea sp. LEGE XX443]
MYYQLWNFFLKEDKYLYWKEKTNFNKNFDHFTWQKIIDFLSLVEQDFAIKTQLDETDSIEPFIELAGDNGYNLTAEAIAWFVVTRKQIWDLFDIAQKTPSLKEKLLSSKNPQQFIKIAAEHGYHFSIDELAWLLIEIKSSPELVAINNSVGEILTVSNYGRIEIGYWIWLAEDWGIVPPFCHLNKLGNLLTQNTRNPFLLDQCFLPKGYFNQRLMSVV